MVNLGTISQINLDPVYYIGFLVIFLTALSMARQNFLQDNIQTYAFNSFCIFLMNMVLLYEHFSIHLLISGIIVLIIKVIVFPLLLLKILKELNIKDQFENIIDIQFIFIAIGVLTAFSFWILPYESFSSLEPRTSRLLPLTLGICFIGLLLMINRSKTISQILGFLIMENGITLTILFGARNLSSILEFGLAVDLLIGVIIMGIFSSRIKKNLDHIEVRELTKLKDANK
jgi:hydrogenase-4 component E